jgi:hypothetical protein
MNACHLPPNFSCPLSSARLSVLLAGCQVVCATCRLPGCLCNLQAARLSVLLARCQRFWSVPGYLPYPQRPSRCPWSLSLSSWESSRLSWTASSRLSWTASSRLSWTASSRLSWTASSRLSWTASSRLSWTASSRLSWTASSRLSWKESSRLSWTSSPAESRLLGPSWAEAAAPHRFGIGVNLASGRFFWRLLFLPMLTSARLRPAEASEPKNKSPSHGTTGTVTQIGGRTGNVSHTHTRTHARTHTHQLFCSERKGERAAAARRTRCGGAAAAWRTHSGGVANARRRRGERAAAAVSARTARSLYI